MEVIRDVIYRNQIGPALMKIVYPGIYRQRNKPTAGFPGTRRNLAMEIEKETLMFLYVTNPIKKIIAVTRVTDFLRRSTTPKWPFYLPLEYVIGPKMEGVALRDVGITEAPRVGDTLWGLSTEKADDIIQLLQQQQDIDQVTWELYIEKFAHLEEVEPLPEIDYGVRG